MFLRGGSRSQECDRMFQVRGNRSPAVAEESYLAAAGAAGTI